MKSYLCILLFHPLIYAIISLMPIQAQLWKQRKVATMHFCPIFSVILLEKLYYYFTNLFQPRKGEVLDVLIFLSAT